MTDTTRNDDSSDSPEPAATIPPDEKPNADSGWATLWKTEDWWAVWLGAIILIISFLAVYVSQPDDVEAKLEAAKDQKAAIKKIKGTKERKAAEKELKSLTSAVAPNPLKPLVTKLQTWEDNPLLAFGEKDGAPSFSDVPAVVAIGIVSLVLFALGTAVMDGQAERFVPAFLVVFLLTVLAMVMATQSVIKDAGLGYPLWAILIGLAISNTVGTPEFLKPAARTEYYIKTGLVLLGATILLKRLLALGVPGIFVSWVVTPIVLVSTYIIGQKLLKITSKTLNITIAADMSVCGVSAAIATAAACKAKKEELTLAVTMSLIFTVGMMFVMPFVIKATGMSMILGGAWMGGTIDATGAVAAAGELLKSPEARDVAVTVKMIQNILIGVIAFAVAVYWVTFVEKSEEKAAVGIGEIWNRFPKFILGFMGASIVFTILAATLTAGEEMVTSMYTGTTKTLGTWFFAMAFVSIGLESNFRELAQNMQGGKPLLLYVIGQSLNLILTLAMAYLMFEVIFADFVKANL